MFWIRLLPCRTDSASTPSSNIVYYLGNSVRRHQPSGDRIPSQNLSVVDQGRRPLRCS
ncbi:MAG: hypothetical protein MZU97_06845 [Bacillus subtilis]|nr:hypothetical protein [Bacillus subtilis]